MNSALFERLAERYQFDSWRNKSPVPAALFVKNYHLFPELLRGWNPVRSVPHPTSQLRRAATTLWRPKQTPGARLLRVDYCETTSRAEAHDVLLQTLGNFQGPDITRDTHVPLGDVAFRSAGARSIAFARANVVFLVIATEPDDAQDLEAIAGAMDRAVLERPAPAKPAAGARGAGVEAQPSNDAVLLSTGEGNAVAIRMNEGIDDMTQMYKVFAPPGELIHTGVELIFRAAAEGAEKRPKIEVFSIGHGQSRPSSWRRHRVRQLSAARSK